MPNFAGMPAMTGGYDARGGARVEDSSQLTMPEGPGATIEDKVAAMGADFECRQLEEPLHGDGYSVRIMSKDSDACGFTEYYRFSDDFRVIFVNNLLFGAAVDKLRGEDWIKFHYRVAGRGAFLFGNDFLIDLVSPICTIRLQPSTLDEGHWYGNESERLWLTVYCKRSVLIDGMGLDAKDFPGSLRRFLAGGAAEPFFKALVMTPQMRRVVTDLATATCAGNLRRLLIESMARELICLSVHALGRTGEDLAQESGLKPPEVKRLHQARDILESSLAHPPSVTDLASQVGINRTKLRAGFKQLFGTTIFEFCKEQRLDKAWTLLEVEGMTIGQVAEATGYEYDANFSTAFKKHFGILPKDVRKRSAN